MIQMSSPVSVIQWGSPVSKIHEEYCTVPMIKMWSPFQIIQKRKSVQMNQIRSPVPFSMMVVSCSDDSIMDFLSDDSMRSHCSSDSNEEYSPYASNHSTKNVPEKEKKKLFSCKKNRFGFITAVWKIRAGVHFLLC